MTYNYKFLLMRFKMRQDEVLCRFNPSQLCLKKKKLNDYLLAANPRSEFVCNFPQEIYRGTSLPAAVPSSVSPLSRGAGGTRGIARARLLPFSPHFFLPFPCHPRQPSRTHLLFLLSRSERTSLVRVPLPVLAILHPSIDDAKAKGERGG